jgi:hypothetical protein
MDLWMRQMAAVFFGGRGESNRFRFFFRFLFVVVSSFDRDKRHKNRFTVFFCRWIDRERI